MKVFDIAFTAKFIDNDAKEYVLDLLTEKFKDAKIPDIKLKIDVGFILEAMVVNHIESETKQIKFLRRINMKAYKSDIEEIIYDLYGDDLYKKDVEIEQLNKTNKTQSKQIDDLNKANESQSQQINDFKHNIAKLREIGDLTSPEAIKIINALMLMG